MTKDDRLTATRLSMFSLSRCAVRLLPVVMGLALCACAIPVRQIHLESALIPAASTQSFVLSQDAKCAVGTGYSRTLRSGTRWELVGSISQGEVYRSRDQDLTVEGYNVHEAYLVVKEGSLVGFYLPVEKTFAPASKITKLSFA